MRFVFLTAVVAFWVPIVVQCAPTEYARAYSPDNLWKRGSGRVTNESLWSNILNDFKVGRAQAGKPGSVQGGTVTNSGTTVQGPGASRSCPPFTIDRVVHLEYQIKTAHLVSQLPETLYKDTRGAPMVPSNFSDPIRLKCVSVWVRF